MRDGDRNEGWVLFSLTDPSLLQPPDILYIPDFAMGRLGVRGTSCVPFNPRELENTFMTLQSGIIEGAQELEAGLGLKSRIHYFAEIQGSPTGDFWARCSQKACTHCLNHREFSKTVCIRCQHLKY